MASLAIISRAQPRGGSYAVHALGGEVAAKSIIFDRFSSEDRNRGIQDMTCIQGYSLQVHRYEALARLFPNVGSFMRALLDHLQVPERFDHE